MQGWKRRDVIRRGEPETVVPIVPRTFIELARLRVPDDVAQAIIAHGFGQAGDIRENADVHRLGDDPSGVFEHLLGRNPPNVFAGQFREQCAMRTQIVRPQRRGGNQNFVGGIQLEQKMTDLTMVASVAARLKFSGELAQRSLCIGLEQFSLTVARASPGQLNASFRAVSAELGP